MAKLPGVELCERARFVEKLAEQVHDERVRTMVALGVMSRQDAKAKRLLDELWQDQPFVRRLVLKTGARTGEKAGGAVL